MRIACLAATVALVLTGSEAWAQNGAPSAAGSAGAPASPAARSQEILVSGVGKAADPAAIRTIVQAGYRQAMAAAGHPAALDQAQLQAAADAITGALHAAGYAQAHAYLPDQVLAFTVNDAAAAPVAAAAKPSAAAPEANAATAPTTPNVANVASAIPSTPATPAATVPGNVVPPVKDRESVANQHLTVRGFRVVGVGQHPDRGITPASMQALADTRFKQLGGAPGQPTQLDLAQLKQVSDALTERYRTAGFIFGTAFLPAQTVGKDDVVEIRVLEGRLGKVIVKGTKRYRPGVIAASAKGLEGKVLKKADVDSALLYARDLPGVSVASTFQPGEHTGETDLLMVVNEAKRPFVFNVGGNNYGTDLTGRYRAQFGAVWNSPLGYGDALSANVDYGFDPRNNVYGALSYRAPTVAIPGLSAVLGATRSELEISNGSFAALDVKGPSQTRYAGMDWKFLNRQGLQMQSSLHYVREESKLSSIGLQLSDERFDVAELGFALNHTDQRFHGIDLLQASVRKSIRDDSREPDLVSPNHAHSFLVGRLSYTRLQFLSKSQRLYLKFAGQYTRDTLAPLEQFALGGPDSVRAYPIADGLADRGYYAALEYHVDAPGFGDKTSPFYARPWRELLELEAFVDYGRGLPAKSARGSSDVTLSGVGAGLIFRIPRFHHFEFHLDGSVPLGGASASDDKGYHIYSRFGFTF